MSPRFSSQHLELSFPCASDPLVPASSGRSCPQTRRERGASTFPEELLLLLLLSQCGCCPLYRYTWLDCLLSLRLAAAWPDRYPPRDERGAPGRRLATLFSLSTTFRSLPTTFFLPVHLFLRLLPACSDT